jgi:hypothetical protein
MRFWILGIFLGIINLIAFANFTIENSFYKIRFVDQNYQVDKNTTNLFLSYFQFYYLNNKTISSIDDSSSNIIYKSATLSRDGNYIIISFEHYPKDDLNADLNQKSIQNSLSKFNAKRLIMSNEELSLNLKRLDIFNELLSKAKNNDDTKTTAIIYDNIIDLEDKIIHLNYHISRTKNFVEQHKQTKLNFDILNSWGFIFKIIFLLLSPSVIIIFIFKIINSNSKLN